MKIEYKEYIIEEYWLPNWARYCYYKKDGSCERMYTANTVEECRQEIDELW